MKLKKSIAGILFSFFAATSAQAGPDIIFGPTPSALDNISVFTYDQNSTEKANWNALKSSGVNELVLNSMFLLGSNIQIPIDAPHAGSGRPDDTFLEGPEIVKLRTIVNALNFEVALSVGIGMSGDVCSVNVPYSNPPVAMTPAQLGIYAANREYNNVAVRLLNNNIPIHTIDGDGLFLRILEHSQKGFSCALLVAKHPSLNLRTWNKDQTALAVLYYIKTLRNKIDYHVTNSAKGIKTKFRMTINLPNWKAGGHKRVRQLTPPTTNSDFDLKDVLESFYDRQKIDASSFYPLFVSGIAIDYPVDIVDDADRNYGTSFNQSQSNTVFADKMNAVWDATRNINPANNTNQKEPGITFIVNSGNLQNNVEPMVLCVTSNVFGTYDAVFHPGGPKNHIEFLPYRNIDLIPVSSGCLMDQALKNSQFFSQSEDYATRLLPGGALRNLLDDRISNIDIDAFTFQSWKGNPSSNEWYMDRVSNRDAALQ